MFYLYLFKVLPTTYKTKMAHRINVNTASIDELKTLPGIGIRTAESIIAYRTSVGWLNEDSFTAIPYLRVSPELLDMVTFSLPERYQQQEEISRMTKAVDRAARSRSVYRDTPDDVEWDIPPVRSEYRTQDTPYLEDLYNPRSARHRERLQHQDMGYRRESEYYERSVPSSRPSSFNSLYGNPEYDGSQRSQSMTSHYQQDNFGPYNHPRVGNFPRQEDYGRPEIRRVPDRRNDQQSTTKPKEEKKGKDASKRLASIPRTLTYNGKTGWKAFYTKFTMYAESQGWSAKECKDGLCMCLEGKASDFYATNIADQEGLEYFDMVKKFEKRFGYQELPETAMIAFNTSHQTSEESLDDWADRVLELATKAYRNLPEEHTYKQAILRFCLGCANREAGEAAANKRPTKMEEAIDSVKWAIHTHSAIHGRRREVRQVMGEGVRYDWSDPNAYVVHEDSKINSRPSGSKTDDMQRRLVGVEKCHREISERMQNIEENMYRKMERMEDKMERMFRLLTTRGRSTSPRPATSPRQPAVEAQGAAAPKKSVECFRCKGDHFLRDCPEKREESKKVQFVEGMGGEDEEDEDLNEEGLDD